MSLAYLENPTLCHTRAVNQLLKSFALWIVCCKHMVGEKELKGQKKSQVPGPGF